jgi:hypothetical protein
MRLIDKIKSWFSVEPAETGYSVPELPPMPKMMVRVPKTYTPLIPHYFKHEIEQIRHIAEITEWKEIDLQEQNKMISFAKGTARVNVYYTTMTVGTCINHPRKGKTQMFRRNVNMRMLEQLLNNPRLHTGLGYRTK